MYKILPILLLYTTILLLKSSNRKNSFVYFCVIHLTLFTVTSFVFNQQFIITMKTF